MVRECETLLLMERSDRRGIGELKSRHQTTAGAGEQGWVMEMESPEAHFPFRGPEGGISKVRLASVNIVG